MDQIWEERILELLLRDEEFRKIVKSLDELLSTQLSDQTMDGITNGVKIVETAQETLLERIEENKKNVDELVEHKTLFTQHAKAFLEYINQKLGSTNGVHDGKKDNETEFLLWSKQQYHKDHIEKYESIYKQDRYDIETWKTWVNETLRRWFEYIASFEKDQDNQIALERLFFD